MTDERQQETWAYAGVRVSAKGKRYHLWQDATGRMLTFAKGTAGSVGSRYQFEVVRAADGSFQSVFLGTKTYLHERHEDAELVAQWQTEHRLAEASLARDRAERAAKSEPDAFEQAVQELRDLRARSCRTGGDRTAFLAMVLDALSR